MIWPQRYKQSGMVFRPEICDGLTVAVSLALKVIFILAVLWCLGPAPAARARETGPEEAARLNREVETLYAQGRYTQALPLARQALAIREKYLGPEHPEVATSLNNLGILYYALGDYVQAEPYYRRSLAIREKILGPDHPHVALSLNNLAEMLQAAGSYDRAEPLFLRALSICEQKGDDQLELEATVRNNLASLYETRCHWSAAESFYRSALAIRRKRLGPEHPDVAESLNNLGAFYYSAGDYARAEPLLKNAAAVWEKTLGRGHPRYAISLNNLAGFYYTLGDYPKAESYFRRSLDGLLDTYGPTHPWTAAGMNNLARVYQAQGDYHQAAPLLKQALSIREDIFGPEHPQVAQGMNNLADLYLTLGDFQQAEALLQKALGIWEKSLGPDHPEVASGLNNLALLYKTTGAYEKAEPLYQRSLAIAEKAFGPEHPDVVQNLNNLASLFAARGGYQKAYHLFARAQNIDETLIEQVLGFTSETEKIKFLATKKYQLHGFLSLTAQYLSHDRACKKGALDVWLRRKGIILESLRRFQEALVYSDAPEALDAFRGLARTRTQISRLVLTGGREASDVRLAELKQRKNELEAKLSRFSQAFARREKVARADTDRVAAAMPPGTVLLDYARIHWFDFGSMGAAPKWQPPHYLVFMLQAGRGEDVELVDLGDAETIDRAVQALKQSISDLKHLKDRPWQSAARQLHDLVFLPVKQKLGAARKIFLSPDGNLNLIPFEILQDAEGRFLIQDYTFNYLASGRDVLGFGQLSGPGGKPLLMGSPDFNLAPREKASTLKRLGLPVEQVEGTVPYSPEAYGLRFSELPEAWREILDLQNILGRDASEAYLEAEALEEVLVPEPPPRILHLATHGFFLSDIELGHLIGRNVFGVNPVLSGGKVRSFGLGIDQPLLRSGVALAGANHAEEALESRQNDGLLTAEEVLTLKMIGTDLVVLSACQTGLGAIQSGEGVFGLRRAFTQAGAKGLVMSMWSVPDLETRELMVAFYRKICLDKLPPGRALRQAALTQMQIVQKRYGHRHPLFWGAFIFLGES